MGRQHLSHQSCYSPCSSAKNHSQRRRIETHLIATEPLCFILPKAHAAMHHARRSSGKRSSYDTAKMCTSAPELGYGSAASSAYPITVIPSSSYSMPDPDQGRRDAVVGWSSDGNDDATTRTTALGHHMSSSELETEAHRPFNCIGICCYTVFVTFLICLIILAIAPAILGSLLELLGITKIEPKPQPPDVENDNLTNALHTPAVGVEATPAPFLDIAETFGEIGVDDDLPDGAFAAPDTGRNNSDSVFDWLRMLGNQTSSTLTQPTTNDRPTSSRKPNHERQNRTAPRLRLKDLQPTSRVTS
ncbi:hypothetical protein MTO96_010908 [Rhipicephalus appendiculatus]